MLLWLELLLLPWPILQEGFTYIFFTTEDFISFRFFKCVNKSLNKILNICNSSNKKFSSKKVKIYFGSFWSVFNNSKHFNYKNMNGIVKDSIQEVRTTCRHYITIRKTCWVVFAIVIIYIYIYYFFLENHTFSWHLTLSEKWISLCFIYFIRKHRQVLLLTY